jgi:hypothetical protein
MATPNKWKAWKEDKMNEAVVAVIRKEMGYLKALKHFGVPQTTTLDLAFMKPLKTYYSQEIESLLLNNFPRIVTICQVGKLFGKASSSSFIVYTANKMYWLREISSSHGGEYEVQNCLLGCTAV